MRMADELPDEPLEVVDTVGRTLGIASRREIHGNPSLLHKVVHVLVFNAEGGLLLQKRSSAKDVAPGKWDTSVGGHVSPGEDLRAAAAREMEEELGVLPENLTFLYSHVYSDHCESEFVHTYRCVHNGPFHFNRDEIDDIQFWHIEVIRAALGSGLFSGHFESEMRNYLARFHTPLSSGP